MQQFYACPHAKVVDEKSNNGKYDKDNKFPTSTHAFFVGEDIAHRCDVVKNYRDGKRNCCTDQVIDTEDFGEKSKQAIVDDKGNYANYAELHNLCDKLFHGRDYSFTFVLPLW